MAGATLLWLIAEPGDSIGRMGSLSYRLAFLLLVLGRSAGAQSVPVVLQLDPDDAFGGALYADRGVVGLRQRLRELRTTASVLQTTAHPDDEQAGLLTYLSRATGARTALLTLNRGEAGANAAGDELFDGLGQLRAAELLESDRYYGLDDQYFTRATDYGFSKSLDEARRSWDSTAVLADMVRVIRLNQPLVVISRWSGTARDGHGQHQYAGTLTPLAVAAAGDSTRFPEQLTDGVRPWRVRRLYRANLAMSDRADVIIDAGRFDPFLGATYQELGSEGLSHQRSQTGGRRSGGWGPAPQRLQLVSGAPTPSGSDVFSGLDVSLPALFAIVDEPVPVGADGLLGQLDRLTRMAIDSLDDAKPWNVARPLAAALRIVRTLEDRARHAAPYAHQLLVIKERQIERALTTAVGLRLSALAWPADEVGRPGVPGESVPVQLDAVQASPDPIRIDSVSIELGGAGIAKRFVAARMVDTDPWRDSLTVNIPADAELSRAFYQRPTVGTTRYDVTPDALAWLPLAPPSLIARTFLTIDGATVQLSRQVRSRRQDVPDGISLPRFAILPPLSLKTGPAVLVLTGPGPVTASVRVEVTGHRAGPTAAEVHLEFAGTSSPSQPVVVPAGERKTLTFELPVPASMDSMEVVAVARADGRIWRESVEEIFHRQSERSYLVTPARTLVRRVSLQVSRGTRVGYVMGVGDRVPDALVQLGATVTLLDAAQVAGGDFTRFDAIVIGTRAYAVRSELPAATASLLAFAKAGGHVVVLYQTPEFHPETMAPYPASLPQDAEETTEEDAPVRLLAASDSSLTVPNRITPRDFDGWIEQRGSKFLTDLAPQYTVLVETHDHGQAPQAGIWVTAPVGTGRWSYVALALHRQLPYGVPGAYRILANLLTPRR